MGAATSNGCYLFGHSYHEVTGKCHYCPAMLAPATPKAAPKAKAPRVRVALSCNECNKKFAVSPNNPDPTCPKCGSVDFDVR